MQGGRGAGRDGGRKGSDLEKKQASRRAVSTSGGKRGWSEREREEGMQRE